MQTHTLQAKSESSYSNSLDVNKVQRNFSSSSKFDMLVEFQQNSYYISIWLKLPVIMKNPPNCVACWLLMQLYSSRSASISLVVRGQVDCYKNNSWRLPQQIVWLAVCHCKFYQQRTMFGHKHSICAPHVSWLSYLSVSWMLLCSHVTMKKMFCIFLLPGIGWRNE